MVHGGMVPSDACGGCAGGGRFPRGHPCPAHCFFHRFFFLCLATAQTENRHRPFNFENVTIFIVIAAGVGIAFALFLLARIRAVK
jgi:hypothetical protein